MPILVPKPSLEVFIFDTDALKLRVTRFDFGFELDMNEKTPEPEITITCDIAVTIDDAIFKPGETDYTHLVLTGGFNVQGDSIPACLP